ncbi:MAG: acetoacetate decarboxylase family protein [Oligoflexus sp.]|nr:acetoacetate decarboxylase family protein [Oligoflexus sp.]
MSNLFPAPWHLKGRGLVFLYKFDKTFLNEKANLSAEDKIGFIGGLGAVMLVNYEQSDCGPYHELLFIPGRWNRQGYKRHSISRIYVSSQDSVVNGRINWGIPKDLADFSVLKNADGSETWKVSRQGEVFFEVRIKLGTLALPIHSSLLPLPLMQSLDKKLFLTKLSAKGWAHRAKLLDVTTDGTNFPNIAGQKPLLGLHIDPFRMKFNQATILPGV